MFGLKKLDERGETLDSLRAENAKLKARLTASRERCDQLTYRLERNAAWVSEQARQITELEESLASMRTQYINKLTDLGII